MRILSQGLFEILFGWGEKPSGSSFSTTLILLLFFSADIEEWRCSGAVAYRLTLLLQCVHHWASTGTQHVEYSVLKRHCGTSV